MRIGEKKLISLDYTSLVSLVLCVPAVATSSQPTTRVTVNNQLEFCIQSGGELLRGTISSVACRLSTKLADLLLVVRGQGVQAVLDRTQSPQNGLSLGAGPSSALLDRGLAVELGESLDDLADESVAAALSVLGEGRGELIQGGADEGHVKIRGQAGADVHLLVALEVGLEGLHGLGHLREALDPSLEVVRFGQPLVEDGIRGGDYLRVGPSAEVVRCDHWGRGLQGDRSEDGGGHGLRLSLQR